MMCRGRYYSRARRITARTCRCGPMILPASARRLSAFPRSFRDDGGVRMLGVACAEDKREVTLFGDLRQAFESFLARRFCQLRAESLAKLRPLFRFVAIPVAQLL